MAINAANIKSTSKANTIKQAALDEDAYPARLVQVIDLGLHPVSKWNEATSSFEIDESKAPVNNVYMTYELVSEFMKDAEGNDQEDRPRWVSEQIPLYPLKNDKATSSKRIKAIDPKDVYKGDLAKMVGSGCTVVLKVNKKGYNKIGSVAPLLKGMVIPELKNDPVVLDLDNPDVEVFESLPEFLKDKITSSISFEKTALGKTLGKGGNKEEPVVDQEDIPEVVEDDDDAPWG